MALGRGGFASVAFLAGALVFGVVLGLVLAFGASETKTIEERWAALEIPEAEVLFLGDFTSDEQESIRRELKTAQVVYADHFGAVTSDFTVVLVTDLASMNQRLAERGAEQGIWFTCGGIATSQVILIVLEDCGSTARAAWWPLAHEYFHILQQEAGSLASTRQRGTVRQMPWLDWLVEGSAVYASALVSEEQGRVPFDVRRSSLQRLWSGLGKPLPLLRSGLDPDELDWYAYNVGFLATELLVERAGPEALLAFFRFGGHAGAFEAAFGISLSDFLTAFEEHRLEVAQPFEWQVSGTVIGADGTPFPDMDVYAAVQVQGYESWIGIGKTGTDGRFELAGPGRDYAIRLLFQCPRDDGVIERVNVGGWGAVGFVADDDGIWDSREEGAEPFTDGDQHRTGMVIELPETRESLIAERCRH